MTKYHSIKDEVLEKLERSLPTLQEKFGVATIGIFGSVSRGEDTKESDIDILVSISPEMDSYTTFLDLADYLETLFERHVEIITERSLSQYIKPYVYKDIIRYGPERGAV